MRPLSTFLFFSSSPELLPLSQPRPVTQNKWVSNDSPAMPQKVGSKGYWGEALRPRGCECLITHVGQGHEGRAAGGRQWWIQERLYNLSPFQKLFEKQAVKRGHCRTDPHCSLQNFNVSSWLRLGTPVQNWNLSPDGGCLTKWLLCSLSGGK